jgi:hypothetical protein
MTKESFENNFSLCSSVLYLLCAYIIVFGHARFVFSCAISKIFHSPTAAGSRFMTCIFWFLLLSSKLNIVDTVSHSVSTIRRSHHSHIFLIHIPIGTSPPSFCSLLYDMSSSSSSTRRISAAPIWLCLTILVSGNNNHNNNNQSWCTMGFHSPPVLSHSRMLISSSPNTMMRNNIASSCTSSSSSLPSTTRFFLTNGDDGNDDAVQGGIPSTGVETTTSSAPIPPTIPIAPRLPPDCYIDSQYASYADGVKPDASWNLAVANFKRQGSTIIDELVEIVGLKGGKDARKARPPGCLGLKLSNESVTDAEKRRIEGGGKVDAHPVSQALYDVGCLLLDRLFDERPIERFWFLEVIARIPYFAYVSMLHLYESFGWFRAVELRKVHAAEGSFCTSVFSPVVFVNVCQQGTVEKNSCLILIAYLKIHSPSLFLPPNINTHRLE